MADNSPLIESSAANPEDLTHLNNNVLDDPVLESPAYNGDVDERTAASPVTEENSPRQQAEDVGQKSDFVELNAEVQNRQFTPSNEFQTTALLARADSSENSPEPANEDTYIKVGDTGSDVEEISLDDRSEKFQEQGDKNSQLHFENEKQQARATDILEYKDAAGGIPREQGLLEQDELKKQISTLQESLQTLVKENNEKSTRIASLEEDLLQLTAKQVRNEELQNTEPGESKEGTNDIQKQNIQEQEELKAQIAALQERMQSLVEENNDKGLRIVNLEADLLELTAKQLMQAERHNTPTKLLEEKDTADEIIQEQEELKTQITALQERLDILVKENNDKDMKILTLEADLIQLTVKLGDGEKKVLTAEVPPTQPVISKSKTCTVL